MPQEARARGVQRSQAQAAAALLHLPRGAADAVSSAIEDAGGHAIITEASGKGVAAW